MRDRDLPSLLMATLTGLLVEIPAGPAIQASVQAWKACHHKCQQHNLKLKLPTPLGVLEF